MRPSSIRIVVVLPEPLGPRKPYTEPAGTARLTPSTASWPPRNRLDSPVLRIAAAGPPGGGPAGSRSPGPAAAAGGGPPGPKPISSRGAASRQAALTGAAASAVARLRGLQLGRVRVQRGRGDRAGQHPAVAGDQHRQQAGG